MSRQGLLRSLNPVFGLLGIVLLVILAGAAGIWLGRKTSPYDKAFIRETTTPLRQAKEQALEAGLKGQPFEPPLYFFANMNLGADLPAVADEIRMAADAGVHRFVLAAPLPWGQEAASMETVYNGLQLIVEADQEATVFLHLSLNPPEQWLSDHPDDASTVDGTRESYPCIASPQWLKDVKAALKKLLLGVGGSVYAEHVRGYIPACLEKGCWFRTGGYDTSKANTAGFRRWLLNRYGADPALQASWSDAEVTLETASIPQQPDTGDSRHVFLVLPEMQRQVDYLRYVSESTAEAIAEIAAHIKKTGGTTAQVLVPYGHSFELVDNEAGHFALGKLFDSPVDGYIGLVSDGDRGLRDVEIFTGPVHSALYHGKQWHLIDDTPTGIARDPQTGELTRFGDISIDDVYAGQRRNFAAALTQGLGLVWADANGDGALYDAEMWERFAVMREAYQRAYNAKRTPHEVSLSASDSPMLTVVVDETSRFYQQCDAVVNERLLRYTRDCALRAGVPAHFCLLSDVLAGKAADAAVYLFVNAFVLPEKARGRLHTFLERKKAAAVWLYAPGYITNEPSAANITATTRITTKKFEGPSQAGSVYQLDGNWIGEGDEFGASGEWDPLFYIDDPETNVLAKYRASEKPSVAIEFLEQGWASVYVAEPSLSPQLLREILDILEQHLFVRDSEKRFDDEIYFGDNLIAIQAQGTGDRILDLGQACDVRDLLDSQIGWSSKRVLSLSMNTGETRLLELTTPKEQSQPTRSR